MERMTIQDIFKTDIERTMPNVDWKPMYAKLSLMLQNPRCRAFRANNSLFIVINNKDHTAIVGMHTADPVQMLPKSFKDFCEAMKKCNFTKIFFTTKRPALLRILERAGYKPKIFSKSTGSVIEVPL